MKLYRTYFEGEGDPPADDKKFTQDDVNRVVAEERRKLESKYSGVVEELDALKKKAQLTESEREDLNKRLADIKASQQSAEELSKQEISKLTKKHQKELEDLTTAVDSWKKRYTESLIVRSITDSAVRNKAFNPSQLVALVRPDTTLIEELDEGGKPTGELIPQVSFRTSDDKGKPLTLKLSVDDAIKRMSEMDDFANLFGPEGAGGVGASRRRQSGGDIDPAELARTDPKKYAKLRREGKIQLK